MADFGIITALATLAGTGVSAFQTIAAGKQEKATADAAAVQKTKNAAKERALGQRRSDNEKERRDLALSRRRALSADSGFDVSLSPDIGEGDFRLDEEGENRAKFAQYEGDENARALKYSANVSRATGKIAVANARSNAFSSLASGAINAYGKYGKYNSSSPSSNRFYG